MTKSDSLPGNILAKDWAVCTEHPHVSSPGNSSTQHGIFYMVFEVLFIFSKEPIKNAKESDRIMLRDSAEFFPHNCTQW